MYNGLTNAAEQYSIQNPETKCHLLNVCDRIKLLNRFNAITKSIEQKYNGAKSLYKPIEYIPIYIKNTENILKASNVIEKMARDNDFHF